MEYSTETLDAVGGMLDRMSEVEAEALFRSLPEDEQDLLKSHVKAHVRIVNGKTVPVTEHDDKRTKKADTNSADPRYGMSVEDRIRAKFNPHGDETNVNNVANKPGDKPEADPKAVAQASEEAMKETGVKAEGKTPAQAAKDSLPAAPKKAPAADGQDAATEGDKAKAWHEKDPDWYKNSQNKLKGVLDLVHGTGEKVTVHFGGREQGWYNRSKEGYIRKNSAGQHVLTPKAHGASRSVEEMDGAVGVTTSKGEEYRHPNFHKQE